MPHWFSKLFRRPQALTLCAALLLATLALQRTRGIVNETYLNLRSIAVSPFAESRSRSDAADTPLTHFLLDDFARMDRYRAENSSLPPATPGRVIFYGDSITEYWLTGAPQQFFPGRPYLDRGVAGQTTPELLWRFHQDVLSLHPDTVVLLAGVNDLLLPHRRISTDETRANLQSMVELAQRHHIRIILCSLLPVSVHSPRRQALLTQRIEAFNVWQRQVAAAQHLAYVDYFSAMADSHGAMRRGLAVDGVHPSVAGYAIMQPLAQKAIDNLP